MSRPSPTIAVTPAAEPKVRGESRYDQVTSLLMATIVGAAIIVAWLGLVYLTNRAYASRVAAPLEIIEVYGGGGGSPEGEIGATEKIDVPGAAAEAFASNNELEAADFEEPSVLQTPATMIDALADASEGLTEMDMALAMPRGGSVASGKRASKLGTGGPGLGLGPGDGGVAREQRWSIIYNPGQTPDEYARQLDFLGVELATIIDNQMHYASKFATARPTRRVGSGQGDDRLYFLWQGRGRRGSDIELLRKAGINVGEGAIFQFYPKGVENTLAQLEVRFRGRQPSEVRTTRFNVVPRGNGYEFKVLDQQTLR